MWFFRAREVVVKGSFTWTNPESHLEVFASTFKHGSLCERLNPEEGVSVLPTPLFWVGSLLRYIGSETPDLQRQSVVVDEKLKEV